MRGKGNNSSKHVGSSSNGGGGKRSWTHPLGKGRRNHSSSAEESEGHGSSPALQSIDAAGSKHADSSSNGQQVPPPLSALREGEHECPSIPTEPETPSSSPGTPPKKAWERSYRNFLKLRGGSHSTKVAPPSLRASTSTSVLAGNIGESEKESSIRGGKLFANVFRGDHNTLTSTPDKLRGGRRVKSFSNDELDETMRRGSEKAYSPHNTRYTSVEPVGAAGAFPQMFIKNTSTTDEMPPFLRPRTSSVEDLANSRIHDALKRDVQSSKELNGSVSRSDRSSPPATLPPTETTAPSSSAMKKAFTEFHNSSKTGRDAVSAFLGDDPKHHVQGAGHSLAWTQNQPLTALNRYASHGDLNGQVLEEPGASPIVSTTYIGNAAIPAGLKLTPSKSTFDVMGDSGKAASIPLDTLHEEVAIRKDIRILKPIQSVDAWKTGRRYLIAPAALAACPVNILTTLSGTQDPLTAKEACARHHHPNSDSSSSPLSGAPSNFGTVILGSCLLSSTSGTSKRSSSNQQWSRADLVLRQNYLLEYSPGAGMRGPPRGFAHLQYAICYTHPDFSDALELHFYGSPCAKVDKRVLMIRIDHREERDDWMRCLNRAANLKIQDLYDYDDSEPIGKGSYASVFSAKRRGSLEPCALKVFDKNQYWRLVVKGRERADTIVREASVQATVTARCGRVPSFVKLLGFFETSDSVVLELELLDGTDLFKYVSSKGVLQEADAAPVMRDILQALEALNRIGLAHRDIKPANILMCPSQHGPTCKIADFGMSTFVGVDGQLRGRCGTPGYVAPEIFEAAMHGGYRNNVDVFSAGVTLYVMLCGYEPFYGESDAELVAANKAAKIDFPEDEWKDISQEGRDLICKMAEPDPSKRISAADALKHPWFQRTAASASVLDGSMSLPATDTPAEDACIIS